MEEVLMSLSCHIWESCCNDRAMPPNQEMETPMCGEHPEKPSLSFHPPQCSLLTQPTFYLICRRNLGYGTSNYSANSPYELQILEGALQMRQKINRRWDCFVVRVNECHPSLLGNLIFPKTQEFTHHKLWCCLLVALPEMKMDISWNFTWTHKTSQ